MKFCQVRMHGALALAVIVAVSGCGGGGSDTVPAAVVASGPKFTGVAAVGKPLANATITVRCATGQPATRTADASGVFSVPMPNWTSPCMVRAQSGSTVLHAATQGGLQVNVTPVSELYVSVMLKGESTAAFFDSFNASKSDVIAGLYNSEARIISKLATVANNGSAFPAGLNISSILEKPFTAASGDVYDGYLEKMSAWLSAHGKSIQNVAKDLLSNDSCRTEPAC